MSIGNFLEQLGILNALSIEIERARREYNELAIGIAQIESPVPHPRTRCAQVTFDMGEQTRRLLRAYDWTGQVDDESVLIIMPGLARGLDDRLRDLRDGLQHYLDTACASESWTVNLGLAWYDSLVANRDTLLRAALEALELARQDPSHVAAAPELRVQELLSAHFRAKPEAVSAASA